MKISTNQKDRVISLQILLWIWFGIITSFVATNVVNIAKLETQIKMINNDLSVLKKSFLFKN